MALSEAEELELLELEEEEYQAGLAGGQAPVAVATDEPGALEKTMRVLDYDRANTGGRLIAKALEKISGKKVTTPKPEDVAQLKAGFPSTSDMMNEAGYLTDWPKTRAVVGMAGDIASSPTTYATFGASALSKLGKAGEIAAKAITPVESLTRALGKKTWGSAYKALDAEAIRQGSTKIRPSEVLVEKNVWSPTTAGTERGAAKAAEGLFDQQRALLNEATAAGRNPNIDEVVAPLAANESKYRALPDDAAQSVADAYTKEIDGIRKNMTGVPATPARTVVEKVPGVDPSGYGRPFFEEVERTIPATPGRPGVTPTQLSDIKSLTYKGINGPQWAPYAQTGVETELKKAKSLGARRATESAMVTPEKQQMLRDVNEKLGSLLSSKKKHLGEVAKAEMKDTFTSVDAMNLEALLASGASPVLLAIKKAADFAKSPGIRSTAGKAMTSGAPVISDTARRSIWERYRNSTPVNPEEEIP